MLDIFLGEFLGTMFLILLGNGVGANVAMKSTFGTKSGFLAIAIGWGFAVFIGVVVANSFNTGGHINPAVTIMLLTKGDISATQSLVYMASQFLGATLGQVLVSLLYFQHMRAKENADAILGVHSTGPTHKKVTTNLFSEILGTAVLTSMALILVVSYGGDSDPMKALMTFIGPLSMGLVVLAIGLSLGGVTGYAINPFRDLCPRIVYQLSPYPYKKSANWPYAWIPVVGPAIAGVIIGAFGRLI